MAKCGKTEIAQEKCYAAKISIKIWNGNVSNIVISKLVKTKTNPKYLIGYLDEDIRPLVLIMPKMSRYVKAFKVKNKNSKFISFRIDDEKLLQKYKAICTKIEDFKLNILPLCDDRYIKTKVKTFGDKFYTNFRGLNVPEDDIELNLLQSFLLIPCLYTKTNITCKYI